MVSWRNHSLAQYYPIAMQFAQLPYKCNIFLDRDASISFSFREMRATLFATKAQTKAVLMLIRSYLYTLSPVVFPVRAGELNLSLSSRPSMTATAKVYKQRGVTIARQSWRGINVKR